MEDILNQLTSIFKKVFDNEQIVIEPGSTAKDFEEWDSLSNVMLIVEIEKHFGIKFSASEIAGFKNVGDIINHIGAKL